MNDRRRRTRGRRPGSGEIRIAVERGNGSLQTHSVKLADVSDWGVGFETSSPMVVGASLYAWGASIPNAPDAEHRRKVRVMHCRLAGEGAYRAGCSFEDTPSEAKLPIKQAADVSLVDHYEALQLSPSADSDTVHRVYRLLAQRYHPDNPDTGNATAFHALLQAHRVLSDPEKRAAYDIQHQASRALSWKIFETPQSSEGIDAERRKRAGVLSALYSKRIERPDATGLTVRELEELLSCPREHLDFTLWYLRQKNWIHNPENGRYEITVGGVDASEELQDNGLAPRRALPEPTPRLEAGYNGQAARAN